MAVFTIGASSIAGGGGIGGKSNLTTVGAVPYVSATGVLNQDASNFFWDATNHRLGIGTASPSYTLHVSGVATATAWTVIGGNAYGLRATGSDGIIQNESSGEPIIRMKVTTQNVIIGDTSTDGNYRLDVSKSGSVGTARFYDQTATTGSTLVTISRGAGQSNTSNVLAIDGTLKFGGQNTTGAGSAALSNNCPATTATAPYTWIRAVSSDGSTVYIPCWK